MSIVDKIAEVMQKYRDSRGEPMAAGDCLGLAQAAWDVVKAENEQLRDALFDMVWQFSSNDKKLSHSFLSAEEYAFDVLGLENGMSYEEAERIALKQEHKQ